MRKPFLTAACGFAILALATAATAQHAGGGGGMGASGGMGGGMSAMGQGMGAGPPISPPGQMGGMGASGRAGDIASQRGQFGRDFAAQQHLTPTEYQAQAQQHRADALAIAKAARSGAALPKGTDARIREALKNDMETWRDTFKVDRKSWQAMRDQWLVDRKSLSPQQWAEQRAAWFAARDTWIANQKQWASARSTNRTH